MDNGPVAGPSTRQDGGAKKKKRIDVAAKDKAAAATKALKKKPEQKKKPPETRSEPESKSDESDDRKKCRLGLIIGHQIGSGSFAKVYKAFSCQRQKDVAVKIFKRSDIPKTYFDKFIMREIEVIKELRHRNLVKFYDCQFTTKRYAMDID